MPQRAPEPRPAPAAPRASALGTRASLRWGLGSGLLLVALALLGDLPARWALAAHQARLGKSFAQFLVLGFAVDLFAAASWVSLGALLGVVLGGALVRARGERARALVRWGSLGWPCLAFLLLWLGGVGATEFRLQRGLYPTWADLRNTGDSAYWTSAVQVLWFRRYLLPALVAVPAAVACIVLLQRLWRRLPERLLPAGIGWAAVTVALGLGGWAAWFTAAGWLPTVHDRREVSLPIGSLLSSGAGTRNIRWGLRAAVEQMHQPPERVALGAALLGVPPEPSRALAEHPATSCTPHPFARPFPDEELALVRAGTLAAGPAFEPRIAESLGRLSHALFAEGAPGPVHVWHLLLESFRAEDLHALQPNAPRELAPFATSLYDDGVPGYAALTAKRLHQAGVRTSQALAAQLCGLGSMPYDVSFARDLGRVPARCLLDVLADAGFDSSLVYGEKSAFDNMLDFAEQHRVDHILDRPRFPADLPSGGWGIGDIALMRALFGLRAAVQRDPAHTAAYSLVLTITNHHPFGRPEDTPSEVVNRVAHLAGSATQPLASEDRDRLVTYAYTDEALRQFFVELGRSPWADRSLVLLSADHSTADVVPWRSPTEGASEPLSVLPFAIVVPERWLSALAEPEAARQALADVRAWLEQMPLSENDVPAMVLALLSASAPFASLRHEQRWHTLGGQRTSPHYRLEPLGGGAVWGIDAENRLFTVGLDGTPRLSSERCGAWSEGQEPTAPSLEPVAGLLGAFLRGFDAPCRGSSVPNGR